MAYAVANAAVEEILGDLGFRATLAATRTGYRLRIPGGTYVGDEGAEVLLARAESVLAAAGFQIGARQTSKDEAVVHLGASAEMDERMLWFVGTLERISPDGDWMHLILEDTVFKIHRPTQHMRLARDGDMVFVTYRRTGRTGQVVEVADFRSNRVPVDTH